VFARKRVELPISSTQAFVLCSPEYQKFYLIKEMLNYLTPEHQDVMGMRTICPINNLQGFKQLSVLQHPFMFNGFLKSGAGTEGGQVEEVRKLLENDQLEELQFEMRLSGNPDYARFLASLKHCQKLRRLMISVSVKQDLVELLNKSIGKDTNLRQLSIHFLPGAPSG
jgi:hypothetical protein